MKKQLIVGLTGPSGAGKSTVAARFAERGFFVVDADAVARRAAAADSPALPMLCAAFGADVVRADGSLDRRLLADRAFATKEGTQQLNSAMGEDLVRIFIDHPEGVSLALCERVTHLLPDVRESFALEVSSPGRERPLSKPAHFRRFLGRRARVRTREARDGHKSFTGELVGASDSEVTIAAGTGVVAIPYDDISRSNLVES